jgi:ribosomal protein S18 acetylase RimI-like enzyme
MNNRMEFLIDYFEASNDWRDRVREEWGEKAARHMHIDDGFTIIAVHQNKLAGMISVYWHMIPKPLAESREGFIDIIEVGYQYRRRGIASQLIHRAAAQASGNGAYQIRAWSSEDKLEAILMWRTLGFSLAPAVVLHGDLKIRGFYAAKVL